MPDLSAYPKLAAGFMALFPTAPVTRLLSGLIAQELYLRAGRWHGLRARAEDTGNPSSPKSERFALWIEKLAQNGSDNGKKNLSECPAASYAFLL